MAQDPLKSAQKQLKLSQKLSDAILNYTANEDYQHGPMLEELRRMYDQLSNEQQQLNAEIYGQL